MKTLDSNTTQIESLRNSLKSSDFENIRKENHKIKKNLTAFTLSNISKEIEILAKKFAMSLQSLLKTL